MNQATTTTASADPVGDLEALRLQLKEDGKFYRNNRNPNPEKAHERLLHTLQRNDCREIMTAVVDGDVLAIVFTRAGNKGHVDILEAFVNHGMNIDIKDEYGCTALMEASWNGHEECFPFLFARHANVDVQNNDGRTALIWASVEGHTKIVEILLEKNANFDLQNNSGMTALVCASVKGHKEIVELLLNHNADIDLKNNNGNSALDLAKTEEIKEMIRNHVNTGYVLK